MHHYRQLLVWQKAHALTLRVYAIALTFGPPYYRLADQLRSAAHSIPMNITEGTGRTTPLQFAQFLQIGIGSARELDYCLLLAADLGLISADDHALLEACTEEVTKMLVALRQTVLTKQLYKRARA